MWECGIFCQPLGEVKLAIWHPMSLARVRPDTCSSDCDAGVDDQVLPDFGFDLDLLGGRAFPIGGRNLRTAARAGNRKPYHSMYLQIQSFGPMTFGYWRCFSRFFGGLDGKSSLDTIHLSFRHQPNNFKKQTPTTNLIFNIAYCHFLST